MPDRPQKISFAQMRNNGVRGLLIYCSDYKCSHLITDPRRDRIRYVSPGLCQQGSVRTQDSDQP